MTTFRINRKTLYFVVILTQREFFLKTLVKYNCSGPSAFKCQVEYYSIIIGMEKSFNQSAQFIKSFVRYTWFKSPTIFKALPIFDHTHPTILKVTFSFHKFVSACKNAAQFMDLFLRYNRF